MEYSIQQQQQQQQSIFASLTLDNILDDLAARFIVNLPEEELESMDRVCFQIEQAHWYYEDFVRPTAINLSLLPSMTLKKFSLLMFQSCPLLHDLLPTYKEIWDSFMAYKERVPVCGAVLISEYWDKVLLVKGWNKGASWSFPRGKINKEEADGMCAIREVLEETGFDLADRFPANQLEPDYKEREGTERKPYYIEVVIKEQKIRLYFIHDVKEDTHFETRTRKEISKIDWFKLSDLPTWGKNKKAVKEGSSSKQPKFYMVTPFISHLKLWIDRNKPKDIKKRNSNQSPHHNHSTPSSSHNSTRQQPPHFEDTDDDPIRDNDFNRSFSPSPDSTEEAAAGDGDDENENFSPIKSPFATTDEGTLALSAFFFGGGAPSSSLSTAPVSVPSRTHHHGQVTDDVATKTPPQLLASYERQTSLVQPRPKATSRHTSNLLALLREPNPIVSPKPKEEEKLKNLSSGTNLLSTLDHLFAGVNSTTANVSYNEYNTPPPIDLGDLTETETEEERNEMDRKEKHNALLRALYTVVTKTPPPPISVPTAVIMTKQYSIGSDSGARRMVSPTFSAKEEWDRLQQSHQEEKEEGRNLEQVVMEAVRVEVLPTPKAKSGINLLSILNGRRDSSMTTNSNGNTVANQPLPPQPSNMLSQQQPQPENTFYHQQQQQHPQSFPTQHQQQHIPSNFQNYPGQPPQLPFFRPFHQPQQPLIQQQEGFNGHPQQFNQFAPPPQQFQQQQLPLPSQHLNQQQQMLPFPPHIQQQQHLFPLQLNQNQLPFPSFPNHQQQSQPQQLQQQRPLLPNFPTNQQQQQQSSPQQPQLIRPIPSTSSSSNNVQLAAPSSSSSASTFAPFSPLPQAQPQPQPEPSQIQQKQQTEEERLDGFPPLGSPAITAKKVVVGVRQNQLLSLFNAKVVL